MKNKKNLIIIGIIALLCILIITLLFFSRTKDKQPPVATEKPVSIFMPNNSNQNTDENSEEDVTYEAMPTANTSIFSNNVELNATDKNGGVLTVGINGANVNGIIIAPRYVLAEPDYKIGYYITNTYNSLLGFSQDGPKSATEEPILSASNVYIDWTYDKLYSVDYIDNANYGVRWYLEYNNTTLTSDILNIAVIDMNTHNLIASYDLEIARNGAGNFEIHDLYCTDISVMPGNRRFNKLSGSEINIEETKNDLINKTIGYINSGDYITVNEPFNMDLTTIDLLNNTFHLYFSTPERYKKATGLIKYPIYAVTIQSVMPSVGHYTFYYDLDKNFLGYDYFRVNSYSELKPYIS